MLSVLHVAGGTVISALAGYMLVGSRIFDIQSQFFHFILAGFSISLMWVFGDTKRKILLKGGMLLFLFVLYRLFSYVSFTHLIARDILYFIMFFALSFTPPDLWSRFILNRPVIRFFGSGLIVSAGYSVTAVILDQMYPSVLTTLPELLKVNWLYGLTIGMSISLGFELIHAVMTGFHVKSFD